MIHFLLAAVLTYAGATASAVAADAGSARGVIDTLDTQLLATMKQADALGFAGRYEKLAPAIDRAFDLQRIARLALGSEWATLDADQQQAYVEKFRVDTIATYAQRFDGYDGQHFEITGAREAAGGRRQVNTVIVDAGGKRTPINYVLEGDGGDWHIVNVVARGVSDLALKRGQYTGVIRNKGPAAFLAQFDRQLKKYPALPDR